MGSLYRLQIKEKVEPEEHVLVVESRSERGGPVQPWTAKNDMILALKLLGAPVAFSIYLLGEEVVKKVRKILSDYEERF